MFSSISSFQDFANDFTPSSSSWGIKQAMIGKNFEHTLRHGVHGVPLRKTGVPIW
jgi:hypothetical protein